MVDSEEEYKSDISVGENFNEVIKMKLDTLWITLNSCITCIRDLENLISQDRPHTFENQTPLFKRHYCTSCNVLFYTHKQFYQHSWSTHWDPSWIRECGLCGGMRPAKSIFIHAEDKKYYHSWCYKKKCDPTLL